MKDRKGGRFRQGWWRKEPKTYRWKFMREGLKSDHGELVWKLGQWQTHEGRLELCESGLHCSRNISQAFSFVHGEILARVEVWGRYLMNSKQEVWENMRIVRAYRWGKGDSVRLLVFAARSVLLDFETVYPSDKRPRQAIRLAARYLRHSSDVSGVLAAAVVRAAQVTADPTARVTSAAYVAANLAYAAANVADMARANYACVDIATSVANVITDPTYRTTYARVRLAKMIEKWLVRRVRKLERIE